MSRKRKAPVRKVYPDPKFHSEIVSKFINSIMYDGKRSTAEKILYDALDKIKSKNNEDPLKIFNSAINNVKPNCVAKDYTGKTMGKHHLSTVTFGDAHFNEPLEKKDAGAFLST